MSEIKRSKLVEESSWHLIRLNMKILAIETSCDETAIAAVEAKGDIKRPKFNVIKNIISSQILVHRPFGGVVPNLAKREHLINLPIVLKKIGTPKFKIEDTDLFAVTIGPGLEPALWTGINFAKDLAKAYKKPISGINHLEAHLYSSLLSHKGAVKFPTVALIVSGGHTILLKMESLTEWKKIGETRDDAVGEAFDKVARLLGLQYPGGPELEKLAKYGDPNAVRFPRPMIHQKNYDFSFSGIKTSVLYYLRDLKSAGKKEKADIAASFQQAVIETLVTKTIRASNEYKAKTVILGGGVAANKALKNALRKEVKMMHADFLVPTTKFNTDNAAMIAVAAYINSLTKKKYRIVAQANLNM